jgi:DNA repair ATPase RecN
MLEESGIDADPGEPVILRRMQSDDGRTRGFVNDQPASAGLLKTIGRALSRSTASTTTGRWSTPRRTGICSTPLAV